MEDLDKITKDIEELDKKITSKQTELEELKTKRADLVKSVRNAIKKDLQEKADKYGFVIRNKTKAKKKVVEIKAEE